MKLPIVIPTAESAQQSTAPLTLSTSSESWGSCVDKASPANSYSVSLEKRCRGQRNHVVKPAAMPDGGAECEELCVAPSMDTTAAEERAADDMENCKEMPSKCEEVVLPPSRCAGVLVDGVSSPATPKLPGMWCGSPVRQSAAAALVNSGADDPHLASAARAAPLICSAPLRISASEMDTAAQHALKNPSDYSSFASKAMHAITLQASTAGPPLRSNCSRSDLSSLVGGSSVDDPTGVRQLYSMPGSRVGSSLGIPTLAQRGAAQLSAAADAFSMERFAAFYEVALEELVDECERRVTNAPAAWRDSQRQLIGGDMNRDLATSTHSFDSPRSSAMSPLGRVPSSVALNCNALVNLPCFTNPLHNTHGLHLRELSGDIEADPHRTPAPPPPLSLHTGTAFFSVAGHARQEEQETTVGAKMTVSTLLAALGRHHGKMAPMVFIAGLAYLARVTMQCASEFLSVTRANWYRLTTTAILVAAKVYDDHSSSRLNACFARSSGIPLEEMTRLELDFLYLLDFDLLLKESEVEQWLIWMETLALRRDVMTPLNSYVLGTSASMVAAQLASPPKQALTSRPTLSENWERSKTGTICEASRTPGLSSVVLGGEDETVRTSSSSAAGPRSFSQVYVASNSMETAHGVVDSAASSRCLTGAAAEADMPSLTAPLAYLPSFPLRSAASSMLLPPSLLDGTFSAVSAASLPGGAPSSLNDRRAFVPPLPIHNALPLRPPMSRTRLFSVVHGTVEPPSPISVRQLCRLSGSLPSPLRPPSVERRPPVRFFKSQGTHPHGPSRHVGGAAGSTDLALYGTVDSGCKVLKQWFPERIKRAGRARTAGRASAPAVTDAKYCPDSAASHQYKKRWGPFGMVQHVRDVLGVTASLVRGQLNVLAPSTHAEEVSRLPPPQQQQRQSRSQPVQWSANSVSGSGGRVSLQPQSFATPPRCSSSGGTYPPFPAKLMGEPKPQVGGAPPATTIMSLVPTGFPPQPGPAGTTRHHGVPAPPGDSARRSRTPRSSPQRVDPYSSAKSQPYASTVANVTVAQPTAGKAADEAYADGDYSHDEEDEEYEECEYGYYDEGGYFHYYDDEGVEGEYDDYCSEEEEGAWYEEDEEDEAAYFQRCRRPLTHSPPSL
ncbi:G1_cyclin_CycE4 [Leishmania braziliensis MHOM/BR/75/M2904]|nr:G1_cyclin_CycE4 [Leishmania braziliensis MHOM/BR/75/M2904]